jgi:hypothetical protein
MNKKDREFIEMVKSECKRLGVKCNIKDVKYLKLTPKIRCSGYFDDTAAPILAAAMNQDNAMEILVHEYCHMTQWNEGISLWKEASVALTKIDEWLGGKNVRGLDKAFQLAIELELDNEKRSVKTIKKFGLSINTDLYTKKANTYLQFYNWMKISRKWSNPSNQPYKNKRLIEAMPANFKMNYDKLSPKIEKIFREENI